MDKQVIRVPFGCTRDVCDLEGNLDNTLVLLSGIKAAAESQGYTNLSICFDHFESVYFMGDRLETDQEYARRVKREERMKQEEKKKRFRVKEKKPEEMNAPIEKPVIADVNEDVNEEEFQRPVSEILE